MTELQKLSLERIANDDAALSAFKVLFQKSIQKHMEQMEIEYTTMDDEVLGQLVRSLKKAEYLINATFDEIATYASKKPSGPGFNPAR